MTDYKTILVKQDGRVGTIPLNRPEAMNALNEELAAEVLGAAQAFDSNPGIGAIILTGSERVFAAGADIKDVSPWSYVDMYHSDFFADWDRLAKVRTPLIAAVAGHALGGGCELAMICDFTIAAERRSKQSTRRSRCPWPRASMWGAGSTIPASPLMTRQRACRPSSKSVRRTSSTAEPVLRYSSTTLRPPSGPSS